VRAVVGACVANLHDGDQRILAVGGGDVQLEAIKAL
jgi:hypothetical protein